MKHVNCALASQMRYVTGVTPRIDGSAPEGPPERAATVAGSKR
jgi:hypothetical protein